ncbi:maleylpyruvate isomerase family mycothiol-dependent enzyme [Catenuloplanes japonicus]|uniref:maleylpyruvate isomerase family mycothiol-dependent enzyme n=1 Tax=Catenuloplanes japonicus TaxID=33876 RepID=UPI0005278A72|nr:maleylpyruvate isomerase family mycothiol-dependent enzyme [Catenuloplanes japonicus]
MSTDADRVIAVLRTGHDELAAFVGKLSPDDLTKKSGADEWTIAQTLSHLGSGSEIQLAQLTAGRDGTPQPGPDFNPSVWARWDPKTPAEQAADVIEANGRLVEAYEALDEAQRATVLVDLGFLPAPVPVAVAGRMRLSEFAFHRWDVEAGLDADARLMAPALPLLVDQLPNMTAWLGRTEPLEGTSYDLAVVLTDLDRTLGLRLGERVELTDAPATPDGTLTLPAEAFLRLVYGRLKPGYNADGVAVTGPLSLDDLRRVFPGF